MSDLVWASGTFNTVSKSAGSLIGRPHEPSPETRRLAALAVASKARDAAECGEFLSMLGLTAEEGRTELEEVA